MVVAAGRGCQVCHAPMLPCSKRRPRKLCERPECMREQRRRQCQMAKEARARNVAQRKKKRCPVCDRDKPLTREHWTPKRARSGVLVWCGWCKPCSAAIARDRYHAKPEVRERHLRAAERQRARGGGTVRNPGAHRALRAERERRRRRADHMPRLPAGPLVELVAYLSDEKALSVAETCAVLGFTDRTLRDWREGRRATAQWDVADQACQAAGVAMEALWPELAIAREVV